MEKRELDKEFKDAANLLRVMFVCTMWLTGFDVKCLSCLYLGKPLKAHTLMQTIARANMICCFPKIFSNRIFRKSNKQRLTLLRLLTTGLTSRRQRLPLTTLPEMHYGMDFRNAMMRSVFLNTDSGFMSMSTCDIKMSHKIFSDQVSCQTNHGKNR